MPISCALHARARYQVKEVRSMHKTTAAGAAAGAIGGVVFAGLMRLFPVGAEHRSMIAFAADLVRGWSPLIGWLVYPVYGTAIGSLFGWLLGWSALDKVRAAMWGGLYGVGWWIAAELVLIPALLALWPLSISAVDRVRDVALPLLVGHVVYGVILGIGWSPFMGVRRPAAGGRQSSTHTPGRGRGRAAPWPGPA